MVCGFLLRVGRRRREQPVVRSHHKGGKGLPDVSSDAGTRSSKCGTDTCATRRYTQWPFQTNITYAVLLALFTTLALQALFDVGIAMEDPFDDFGLDNIDFYTVVEHFESYILDTDYMTNVWSETVLGAGSLLDANMYSRKAVEGALGTIGGSSRLATLRTSSHGSLHLSGSPSAHF